MRKMGRRKEQIKPKSSVRKKIIKTRAEIDETENRKTTVEETKT